MHIKFTKANINWNDPVDMTVEERYCFRNGY